MGTSWTAAAPSPTLAMTGAMARILIPSSHAEGRRRDQASVTRLAPSSSDQRGHAVKRHGAAQHRRQPEGTVAYVVVRELADHEAAEREDQAGAEAGQLSQTEHTGEAE